MIGDIKKLCASGNKNKAKAIILSQLDSDRFKKNMFAPSLMGSLDPNVLFSIDNNMHLDLDKNRWDYAYWTIMCVELSNNFSNEKLEHIINIMQHLRDKKNPKFMPDKPTKNKPPSKPREEVFKNNDSIYNKYIEPKIKGFINEYNREKNS